MADVRALPAHQFEDLDQQHAAGTLGMWIFLGTEIMFFGGLFVAYSVYRSIHFPAFEAGSRCLEASLGATNTAVLIASSLTVALAVRAAQLGQRKSVATFIAITMLFGLAFLGIKGVEYYHHYEHSMVPGIRFAPVGEDLAIIQKKHADVQQVELFMCFYFFMTALHALHMIVGLGIMSVMLVKGWRGRFSSAYYVPMEVSGLYWHFVDIVWIFLFPLLYLIGGRY